MPEPVTVVRPQGAWRAHGAGLLLLRTGARRAGRGGLHVKRGRLRGSSLAPG